MNNTIYLNEFTEKFASEVRPQLDFWLQTQAFNFGFEVIIENCGAKTTLVNKVVKYLKDHDCIVTVK